MDKKEFRDWLKKKLAEIEARKEDEVEAEVRKFNDKGVRVDF